MTITVLLTVIAFLLAGILRELQGIKRGIFLYGFDATYLLAQRNPAKYGGQIDTEQSL